MKATKRALWTRTRRAGSLARKRMGVGGRVKIVSQRMI
jgi:hypothetical protein